MGNYIGRHNTNSEFYLMGIDFFNMKIETKDRYGKIHHFQFTLDNMKIEKLLAYPMPEKLCFGLYLKEKNLSGRNIVFDSIILDLKPNQIPIDIFKDPKVTKNITVNPQALLSVYPNMPNFQHKNELFELLTNMLTTYDERIKIMKHIKKYLLKDRYYKILNDNKNAKEPVNDSVAKAKLINTLNKEYNNIFVWDEPNEDNFIEHNINDTKVMAYNNSNRYINGSTFGVGIKCTNISDVYDFISKYKHHNSIK